MSWQDIMKDDDPTKWMDKYIREGAKKDSPSIYDRIDFGGQRDARVEYINKELKKDVDKLVEILKETPSNIFHDVKQDFQELLEKYSEYLRD